MCYIGEFSFNRLFSGAGTVWGIESRRQSQRHYILLLLKNKTKKKELCATQRCHVTRELGYNLKWRPFVSCLSPADSLTLKNNHARRLVVVPPYPTQTMNQNILKKKNKKNSRETRELGTMHPWKRNCLPTHQEKRRFFSFKRIS